MRDISPLTPSDLLAAGQRPRQKLEVWDGAAWVDLSEPDEIGLEGYFLTGYTHRKRIDVSGTYVDAALVGFPLLVKLTADKEIGAVCRADGFDIRFTAADGATLLDYERESFAVSSGAATGAFWVRVPTIPTTGTTIFVYFGLSSAADGASPAAVWDSDFKAVYHMKDATTSTILDSTVNAIHGTKGAANEPLEADGIIGKAQDFDGTNDFIQLGSGIIMSPADSSCSLWFKPNLSARPYGVLLSYGENGAPFVNMENANVLSFEDDGGAGRVYFTLASSIVDGQWHQLTVTRIANSVRMYVNGLESTSGAQTKSGNATFNSPSFYGAAAVLSHIGMVDELRFSSVARSAAWLKFEYRNMAEADNCLAFGPDQTPLSAWKYRKQIHIDPAYVDADLEEFPVLVYFNGDADLGAHALSTGYDIRFTAGDGLGLLKHERESWAVSGGRAYGYFWVRVPLVSASAGADIYVYYGNPAASDGQDPAAAWADDFKAVWHLWDDPDTSHVADSTANGKNGNKTAAGAPAESDALVGKGQLFDGVDDRITVGSSVAPNFAQLTLSAWLKPTAFGDGSFRHVLESGWNNNGTYVVYFYYTGNIVSFGIKNNTGSGREVWTSGLLDSGAFGHFVFTYDGTYLRIFHNGELKATSDPLTGEFSGGAAFYLGQSTTDFKGYMDEARVAAVARSAAWIKFEYRNIKEAGNCLVVLPEQSVSKSRLQSLQFQLASAGPDSEPLAGTWSAVINNGDGLFHPFHPTSVWKDLIRLGRKVRISFGGIFGGVEYLWQQMIGFMDEPSFDQEGRTVQVAGTDYMKPLVDTKLYPPHTHWGDVEVFDSQASPGGTGTEIYAEADACEIGAGEADNVTNWETSGGVVSSEGPGPASLYYLRFVRSADGPTAQYTQNVNCGTITAGKHYRIAFKGQGVTSDILSFAQLRIFQTVGGDRQQIGAGIIYSNEDWDHYSVIVSCTSSGAIQLQLITEEEAAVTGDRFEIDDISIKLYDETGWMKYPMPAACNGVYFVALNGEPVPQGDQDGFGGWHYDAGANSLYFSEDMTVDAGTQNLNVCYYTDQELEEIVADLLVVGRLYANRAAALAAMDYVPTGITIKRPRFDPGTPAIRALHLCCERALYRFWFDADGVPTFRPEPAPVDPSDFVFPAVGNLASLKAAQTISEVRNRISVEGDERAISPVLEDKMNTRYRGEASSESSITEYGEKTHAISNPLFEDDEAAQAAAEAYLEKYKDPRVYITLGIPFVPIPLELGDTITFKVPLTDTLAVEKKAVVRSIEASDLKITYKGEIVTGIPEGEPPVPALPDCGAYEHQGSVALPDSGAYEYQG